MGGNLSVVQDTSVKPPPVMSTMEPAVYVGSGVSVLCLSLVFLTYTSRFRCSVARGTLVTGHLSHGCLRGD